MLYAKLTIHFDCLVSKHKVVKVINKGERMGLDPKDSRERKIISSIFSL